MLTHIDLPDRLPRLITVLSLVVAFSLLRLFLALMRVPGASTPVITTARMRIRVLRLLKGIRVTAAISRRLVPRAGIRVVGDDYWDRAVILMRIRIAGVGRAPASLAIRTGVSRSWVGVGWLFALARMLFLWLFGLRFFLIFSLLLRRPFADLWFA